MGFLESLSRFMIAITGGEAKQQERIKQFEQSLTPEFIKDLEAKGYDVTEYWKTYERVQKEKAEAKKEFIEKNLNSLDYQKLSTYFSTPRDENSDFIQRVVKINTTPLFGKKDWIQRMLTAPIVYGAVVQAHWALFEPGNYNRMGAVFVFSPDPEYSHNIEWLTELAKKIKTLKGTSQVPADCKKLIDKLRDDQSYFCFKIGDSQTGGPEAWCATYTFDEQTYLPDTCIPVNRIVPFVLSNKLEENISASLELIPGEFYTK